MDIKTTIRNIKAMSWESLNTVAQIVGVLLLAFTFGVGAFTVYSQWRLNRIQKEELRRKDEQLARDLSEKDLQIAGADKKAAEANAVAKTAEEGAAVANAEAAKLNERAQVLERDNLVLREDVNKATGEVAILQKEAANARAAQQRVETELAKQQERAANAERALLELQERLRSRQLTGEQHRLMLQILNGKLKGDIEITGMTGDPESIAFSQEIRAIFQSAGWNLVGDKEALYGGHPLNGLFIRVRGLDAMPIRIEGLFDALEVLKMKVEVSPQPSRNQESITLIIGHKP